MGVSIRPARARLRGTLEDLARPLIARATQPKTIRRLAKLPSLPAFIRHRYKARVGAWRRQPIDIPDDLKTVPGIWRDSEREDEAYREAPLHDFTGGNASALEWLYTHMWRSVIPVAPRLSRARRRIEDASNLPSPLKRNPAETDGESLSRALKSKAAELGLSDVGVAKYDRRYEFVEFHDANVGDRVIVCVLEQNYRSTQMIPCSRSEQSALSAYGEIMSLAAELAEWLNQQGFGTVVHGPEGHNVAIHYGVEAGLGQLGLNGQLLTPNAGSRCRLLTINTDAPLAFDHPVDYGIHAICDACKACVRRCPASAIPGKRRWYRGVYKAKLDTERCFPFVAQASGCSVCMKVCPIQKYGLKSVVDEYRDSGKILGRGSDELEGFDWPVDGRHYPPGKLPEIPVHFRKPPGVKVHPHPSGVDTDGEGRLWS